MADDRATLGRQRQVGHDEVDAWIQFAEQWSKEGKGAIKWTRRSYRTFATNAVCLQLHALAYNLSYFMRTLAAQPWSPTKRENLIKIDAHSIESRLR